MLRLRVASVVGVLAVLVVMPVAAKPYSCTDADNPYEEAWQDQNCDPAERFGPYVWMGLGLAAVVILYLMYRVMKKKSPPPPG